MDKINKMIYDTAVEDGKALAREFELAAQAMALSVYIEEAYKAGNTSKSLRDRSQKRHERRMGHLIRRVGKRSTEILHSHILMYGAPSAWLNNKRTEGGQ